MGHLAILGGFAPVATALIALPLIFQPLGGESAAGFALMTAGGLVMFFSDRLGLKAIFAGTYMLTRFPPQWLREEFSRSAILAKSIAPVLVVAGVALVAVNGSAGPAQARFEVHHGMPPIPLAGFNPIFQASRFALLAGRGMQEYQITAIPDGLEIRFWQGARVCRLKAAPS